MELTVACVLRSGGIYEPKHVLGLRRQAAAYAPGARFVCLSDVPVECERVPLESGWPGYSGGVLRRAHRIIAFTAKRPPWNGPSWARHWWEGA